jgi:biopolymer transport protein TolR
MASVGPSGDDGITEINVTPFVDITLVLLVIFMVTAKLMSPSALPLDLPQAATGGETQTVLVVGVDAQGHMTADGDALTDDGALRALAARRLAEVPELRTVIQASSSASHGAVVHVLDELRSAGVHRVAFAVEPAP